MITPNPIAYAVLLLWPYVVWRLYRDLDAGRALIWTVVGSYLILPPLTVLDLPLFPDMHKDTLPVLAAFVVSVLILRQRMPGLPQSWLGRLLMGLFILAPFVTVVSNPDPVHFVFAPAIPGMRIYDSLATVATQLLYALPLFLARRDLATPEAMRELLKVLVVTGLIYSVPMLLESRLSPQLNNWVYGYMQHDFTQTIRFGGYRPMVFTPHGLWLAFFALLCLMASAVFLREGPAVARPKQLVILLWLALILYICKSFGPAAYAMAALPLILLMPPRVNLLVAGVLSLIVISYPLLRGLHLVPIYEILDFARGLNAERAWSLEYRLINEEILLSRAAEKPWFGWGGYGRNFVHDSFTGQVLTVADGHWVIRIGQFGWLGYLAEFGMLCLPLWLMAREALSRRAEIDPVVGALALMLAFNLVDLLPNATIVPLTWLMAGALLGQAELLAARRRQAAHDRWFARVGPATPGRTVI
ncbi:hypothetical protein [Pseudogemmobacter sonorensis]|uniref:hypothetical protein n=1 Tax=Pseudogemmobacter sonorensis TaxID=2989681 RepID=UPI003694EC48